MLPRGNGAEDMKTIAVIPVFNEENTIGRVVEETKKHCDVVVVVDDCSTDRTPQIIQKLGIKYALHGKNKGTGAATRIGILMALRLGADVVVTLDGDGQHNPSQIPLFLSPFSIKDSADIAIGSRFFDTSKYAPEELGFYSCYAEGLECDYSNVPKYRKFGIDIVTWLYNLCHKQKVSDALCCFRAFSRGTLEKMVIEEDGFGFSTEILIKARKKGCKIIEVPVNCIYHKNYRQNSTFSPIKLGMILAWKTIFWRLKLWN